MKLTALIPVYNDDYALGFCLASLVDHFDEILVLDDASTDHTPDVAADFARKHRNVRFHRHEGRQLGWVEIRNRLAALTDSEHLFWLDSDDVLCEYNAHLLKAIAEGMHPVVNLQICEMWGDFHHTTQRLRHYDRCHFYVNRLAVGGVNWKGGTMACPEPGRRARCAATEARGAHKGPGPMLFHIKGVKPDKRLVERQVMRTWLRARNRGQISGDEARSLQNYMASLESAVRRISDEEIHRRALNMLLHSRQDKLVPTYVALMSTAQRFLKLRHFRGHTLARPKVIQDALPGRFQIVYEGGVPVDRVDNDKADSKVL